MSPRLVLPLVATALLLLAVVAARGGSAIPAGQGSAATVEPTPPPPPPTGSAPEPPDRVLDFITGISTGVLLLVIAVMLLIGLVGLLAGLTRRRTRPVLPELDWAGAPGDAEGAAAVPHLLAAARTARRTLTANAAGNPTDAVVAAWLTLEAAAAALGTPRAAHETPTEFTEHVLGAHAADPGALATLRGAYHRARFSPTAVITPVDIEAAADALSRIERSLVAT
ncbi:DUF4129 domain-containing protein [Actinokineospora diospyrosa]|uniref:Protein-glutamine gamma-glutamyltransferase-like C-terminal domain-containing protein n=1 Tax=Actinokineospora diospyrosa TaxID=103728 RepID=A0ABT1IG69_9PSEU|nr:DUF4129 domain-containing protein [Actinokineospora diospyrosa]MCP2271625.1 protein of unknown function (DUF4129) [Actinokineospora diospyrosa]